jgi:DNA-binding winged helix-turn-helix (wHTH) protein
MVVSRPVDGFACAEGDHARKWQFGDFELDAARAELRRAGCVVTTSSLSVLLLDHLLRNRDRVVSREELVAAVWRGVSVSDGTVRQAVWELRRALDDTAESQRFIRTLRGHGYRFVGELSQPIQPAAISPVAQQRTEPDAPRKPRPLFGRGQELAQLEAALAAALDESGRAWVLSGEPGIGKTRVLRQLALHARGRGIECFETGASPDGATPAFWLWQQILEAGLGSLSAKAIALLELRFPAAFRAVRGNEVAPGAPSTDAELRQQRFLLLAELGSLFVRVFASRPCLLLVEDLQWANEASLSFLCHLTTLLPRTRVLLVGTSRRLRARDNRPLAAALEAVRRSAFGQELELGPLGAEAVRNVLSQHASFEVSRELASHVYALSRGNPLFVNELALLLSRRDSVPHESLAKLDLQAVVQRRLQSLPDAVLELLRAASVLSAEFSLAELSFMLAETPQDALTRVTQALLLGVLLEDREPCLRFTHPLVREAAYALLERSERARLHGLAGEWLERHPADVRPTRLNELAHHFVNAAPLGYAQKAILYSLRCAEQAYAATAYQDALAHYDRCLACMDLDPAITPQRKLELALWRGEAMRASGADTTKVNRYFLELAERAELLGDTSSFARAVLGYTGQRAQCFTATRFAASASSEDVALIERALTAVGQEPSELRALLLCSLVGTLVYSPNTAARERAADEARRLAGVLRIPALTARVLATCIYGASSPRDSERRRRDCDALIVLARAHELRAQEADGLITRALLEVGRGGLQAAEADAARARALAKQLGSPQISARAELLSLMQAFWVGDIAKAKQLTQRAFEVASEDLRERALYMMRSTSLQLIERGILLEQQACHEQLLGAYPNAVGLHCALASSNATLGRHDEARFHFDAVAQDDFAALPDDMAWLGEMSLLADAAFQLDDRVRARQVYRHLSPYGQVFAFYVDEAVPAGPVAHWLAALATVMRDFAAARHWLEVTRAINGRLGATMFAHAALLMEARLLFVSDARQSSRALTLVAKVLDYASSRGLSWLFRMADATMQRIKRESAEWRGSAD